MGNACNKKNLSYKNPNPIPQKPISKKKIISEVTALFDAFDFRFSINDQFTFKMRAERELALGIFKRFFEKAFNCYRDFMITTAVDIIYSKQPKNKYDGFIAKYQAPPLVDEIWCLAILYSKKYKELCQALVGGTIFRSQPNVQTKLFVKNIWPGYSEEFWDLEVKGGTIWIYKKQLDSFLKQIYSYLINIYKINEEIIIKINDIDDHLKKIRSLLSSYLSFSNDELLSLPSKKNHHKNFNSEKTEDPDDIFNKIRTSFAPNFRQEFEKRHCIDQKAISDMFIDEYAKFMTMIYFSNEMLSPSEQIDTVWHFHQTYNLEYTTFCAKNFGKFIDHTPTAGGIQSKNMYLTLYCNTLEFYEFLFKRSPPAGLWPAAEERFNPINYEGSWFSLQRLFQCTIKTVEFYKKNMPENLTNAILTGYFSWTGENLFKEKVILIDLKPKPIDAAGCGGCG